jgi:hypothetical protein
LSNQTLAWGALGLIAAALLLFGVVRPIIFPDPTPTPTNTPTPTLTPTPVVLPDLQIRRVVLSNPNPAPGELFFVIITITNAGDAPSGRFSWTWDASQSNPVMQNSRSDTIEDIPPHVSKNFSFGFTYGWWGRYVTRFEVDADSQVVESDERNNSFPFDVETSMQPFDTSFDWMPNGVPVEPPMTLTADTFSAWYLDFSLNTSSNPACADTPLLLIEQGEGIALTAGGENDACKALPLSIRIERDFMSAALLELLPLAAGTARYTYYSDLNGTQAIFTSEDVTLQASVPASLTPGDTSVRQIRRIDVSAGGQPVQLTRLMLSAPQ